MPNRKSSGRWLVDLGCGLAIAAGLIGILELGLRTIGYEYHRPSPIIVWTTKEDRRMEQSEWTFRFHPLWFWEPRPGGMVEGCPNERINSAGFRGTFRSQASPPEGVFRIVALGDSSTFGMGVCADQTYSAALEHELPNTQVLNFGVIGFTAFQGDKLFAGRAVHYHPQLVLIAFGAIDELLPALGYDVESKFAITSKISVWSARSRESLSSFRAFQLLDRALGSNPAAEPPVQTSVNWQAWNSGHRDYVRNQSVASFKRSLEHMVRVARSHHSRVALVIPPRKRIVESSWPWANEYSTAIRQVASRMGVACWDAAAALRASAVPESSLFIDYYHPSKEGHKLYADFLASRIRLMQDGIRSR